MVHIFFLQKWMLFWGVHPVGAEGESGKFRELTCPQKKGSNVSTGNFDLPTIDFQGISELHWWFFFNVLLCLKGSGSRFCVALFRCSANGK